MPVLEDAACAHGSGDPTRRIVAIDLDEASIAHQSHQVDHERRVAIFDLLDGNYFHPEGAGPGPYALVLSIEDDRLVFAVTPTDGAAADPICHQVALSSFKKIIKDYFLICESYFDAIKTAPASRIEAIDRQRRGLHDEGSALLQTRLDGKIAIDQPTARRLFTLVCSLHWKG